MEFQGYEKYVCIHWGPREVMGVGDTRQESMDGEYTAKGEARDARDGAADEGMLKPVPVARTLAGVLSGCAMGFALGLACWALLSLVQLLIELVWGPVHAGIVPPMAMVAVCAAGGAAVGWWNRRFHSAPQPMGKVIAATRAQGGYNLPRPVASLGAFLMPLAFGAPLGPEAGLSGFLAAGGTALSRALHRIVFGADGESRRFDRVQTVSLSVAGIAGVLAGAKVWNGISGRAGIPRLPVVEFSVESLLWLVPLTLLGMSLSWVLRHSDALAAKLALRVKGVDEVRAAVCGAVFALVAAAFPLVLYAGTEQLPALLANPGAHTSLELLATCIAKICLLSLCLRFGWEGGPFFPLIFSAACLGVAVSQVAGIDMVLAVTVLAAALVGRFTRKLGLSLVVMALIVPVRGLVWALLPLAAGALLPTVDELWERSRSQAA